MIVRTLYNFIIFGIGRLRARFWSIFMKHVGKDAFILGNCQILAPWGISIGDETGINHHAILSGSGGLTIGNNVGIGQYVSILTFDHTYKKSDTPICKQPYKFEAVNIEDDVLIGVHAVILPGVSIGKGSVIGAGAVVTRDVKPYSIVGGVPAKLIKYRYSNNKR